MVRRKRRSPDDGKQKAVGIEGTEPICPQAARGKISISPRVGLDPVANLPTDPKGDNNHFERSLETIVLHRAIPGHNRRLSGDADAHTTYSLIVRSTDGGQEGPSPTAYDSA